MVLCCRDGCVVQHHSLQTMVCIAMANVIEPHRAPNTGRCTFPCSIQQPPPVERARLFQMWNNQPNKLQHFDRTTLPASRLDSTQPTQPSPRSHTFIVEHDDTHTHNNHRQDLHNSEVNSHRRSIF